MVQKRNSIAFGSYKQYNSPNLRPNPWWRQDSPFKEIYDETTNEWKLAIVGLIFSLSILTAKLISANRAGLHHLIFEKRLIQYETIITDGEVLLLYTWTNVWKYSRFWFPAVCGIFVTWFTWLMVFLDSCVPGVTPPSPLSPAKFKIQSGHTFHLNYIFAVVIGVLVTAYMYANGITLEF